MLRRTLFAAVVLAAGLAVTARADAPKQQPVRIGAVAYAPSAVTIFDGIKKYLNKNGLAADYVLYSNYDALVDALDRGEVDIAWNTPLAHAQYAVRKGGDCRTLVMRDVDRGVRAVLVVRDGSGVTSPDDLAGKTLILGSPHSAEAVILPLHYLKKQGVDVGKSTILDLSKEFDARGNPCSSPHHVLKALQDGRGDAGVITESLWQSISKQSPPAGLKVVWTTPEFSHCVFTARADLDAGRAARFTKLMLAMDPEDPETAEAMRLEGTRRWLEGTEEGFVDLIDAITPRK